MTRITADDIIALRPCANWSHDRIRAVVGRGLTYEQIARLDAPIQDRRWALTQIAARTDAGRRALVLWAAGCAQDVRHLITDEDARDAADMAVATAVAWAEGCATRDDCLDAAAWAYAASAYAAAYAASAHAAAYAAAYASSCAAAYAASASAYAASASAYAASATARATAPHLAEQHLLDLADALEAL